MPPLSSGGIFNMAVGYGSYVPEPHTSVEIGNGANAHNVNSIAIGYGALTTGVNSISIGYGAVAKEDKTIQIGSRDMHDNDIYLADLNIRDMHARIEELEKIVEKQNKLINVLWYAPGMPGYEEGKEMWNNDTRETRETQIDKG